MRSWKTKSRRTKKVPNHWFQLRLQSGNAHIHSKKNQLIHSFSLMLDLHISIQSALISQLAAQPHSSASVLPRWGISTQWALISQLAAQPHSSASVLPNWGISTQWALISQLAAQLHSTASVLHNFRNQWALISQLQCCSFLRLQLSELSFLSLLLTTAKFCSSVQCCSISSTAFSSCLI